MPNVDYYSEFTGSSKSIKAFYIRGKDFDIQGELTKHQLEQAFKLRAEVFCKELAWVGHRDDQLETDYFDRQTTHIGVFDKSEIAGTLRIHENDHDWMLKTVFSFLYDKTQIQDTPINAEVSRLAVSEKYRRLGLAASVSRALYKGLFTYCMHRGIQYNYMVVSIPVMRVLRRSGLPCRPIGEPKVMDNCTAVACQLDWHEFMSYQATNNPALFMEFGDALASAEFSDSPPHPQFVEHHAQSKNNFGSGKQGKMEIETAVITMRKTGS